MHHPSYVSLVVMWQLMMTAMMAPVAWPWVSLYARLSDGSRVRAGVPFAGGYLSVWLAYSAAAAAVQFAMQHTPWGHQGAPLVVSSVVLAGAGLFQFTPFKQACLRHCRNPLTYFLKRWSNGAPSGFRVGAEHGAFCVGCCWAMMATMIVVGMTSVVWMIALSAAGAAEQLLPRGERIARAIGLALIAAALLRYR